MPAEKSKDGGVIEWRELLELLRGNAGKILLCAGLAVGATALYLRSAHPVYASSALLEVAPDSRQDPNATEDLEASEALKTIELKVASQEVLLGVIRKQHLADDPSFAPRAGSGGLGDTLGGMAYEALKSVGAERTLARLNLAAPAARGPYSESELVQRLAARVDVGLVRGSRLIQVKAEDRDPEKARRLAQAVIDEFFSQSWDAKRGRAAAARELLISQAKRVGDDFRASQERLEAYRNQYHAVSLAERQNIVVERMRDLNQQSAAAKNARLALEAEQAQVKDLAGTDPEALLSVAAIADLPEIVDLRKQIALQEAQVATLSKRYGPLHPTLIQAHSQLDDLHESLRAGIRKAGERIVGSYESARARERSLDSALADQEKAALELDRIAIPYHALEHDAQANGTMYQKVLDELKEADVNHGLMQSGDVDGTDIRVLQPPLAPVRPSRPRPRLLLALALVAGLALGGSVTLASRALDNSLSTVDETEACLGLPVLAAVPRSRHRRLETRPMVVNYPDSLQAEAFRSLRTALSLLPAEEERRCVLLTSAVPAEGKSFCAFNLAAAFAQQGARTLLIDADLRRPGLRWIFPAGPSGKPRLSDCLKDPSRFASAVQASPIHNLSCLGDWSYAPGAAELVGRGGMREVLRLALASYDQVVVDTAPLMAVSDTLHIARHAGAICLVVRAGQTPRRLARRTLRLLAERAKRPVAGVILNRINLLPSNSHHYYTYAYGYART